MAENIEVKVLYNDDQVKSGIRGTENAIKQGSQNMASSLMGVAKALGGLVAIKKVTGFALDAVEAFNKQAQAEAQLTRAIGGNIDALKKQASALQALTLFGDEATISAQAQLATLIKNKNAVMELTPLVQDMATRLGMDLNSAAQLVAKSVGSSTNALARYGVQITGEVGSTERLKSATDALSQAFGGSAKAAAEAGTGGITQMKNAVGDMVELIGEQLLPTFNFWSDAIMKLTGQWQEFLSETDAVKSDQQEIADRFDKQAKFVKNLVDAQKRGFPITEQEIEKQQKLLEVYRLQIEGQRRLAKYSDELNKPEKVEAVVVAEKKKAEVVLSESEKIAQTKLQQMIENGIAEDELRERRNQEHLDRLRQQAFNESEIKRQAQLEDLAVIEENNKRQAVLDAQSANNKIALQDKIRRANLQTINDTMMVTGAAFNFTKAIAGKNKMLARSEAYIMGALAIQKAWASAPFPANIPAVATTTLNTGANIATIESQKFADGGIVQGTSFSGDKVPIMANSGELILNQAQQNNIANKLQEKPNINITIGSVTRETMPELKENLQELADKFRDLYRNGYLSRGEFN